MPKHSMIGCLANYISTSNDKFQPMNANFGIMEVPEEIKKIRDKKERYSKIADRAIGEIKRILQ